MYRFLGALVAATFVAIAQPPAAKAASLTYNFETLDYGAILGDTLSLTVSGVTVTFSGAGLKIRSLGGDFDSTYGLTKYLSTTDDSQQISVTIGNNFIVSSATILNPINGTVDSEVDVIDGRAFNASSVQVDFVTSSAELLTLSGAGIALLTYDDNPHEQGYVVGYLQLEGEFADSAVPVPATLPLFAGGLGILAFLGHRRKRKAATRQRAA